MTYPFIGRLNYFRTLEVIYSFHQNIELKIQRQVEDFIFEQLPKFTHLMKL